MRIWRGCRDPNSRESVKEQRWCSTVWLMGSVLPSVCMEGGGKWMVGAEEGSEFLPPG